MFHIQDLPKGLQLNKYQLQSDLITHFLYTAIIMTTVFINVIHFEFWMTTLYQKMCQS